MRELAVIFSSMSDWLTRAALRLCNMAYAASWLILAAVILRFLLRRAPRWISCLLWALVAFRLVCPITLESALSLLPKGDPLPEQIITGNTFQVNTGIGAVDAPVNRYLASHYHEGVSVSVDNGFHWMSIFGMIWMAGVILLLSYGLISYYRLHRLTRVSVRLERGVYQCDSIDTPFILGLFKPRIYLPSDMEQLQMEYVLAHERVHLKRLDHIWKSAGFLLLSVYWFWPLCWLSYILFCRDIELACDERVITSLGQEGRRSYAEAILSCSAKRSRALTCPLAFGEVGVKERIKNVLRYRKPAFWVILTALACCTAAAVCLLTSPRQEEPGTGQASAGQSGEADQASAGQSGEADQASAGQSGEADQASAGQSGGMDQSSGAQNGGDADLSSDVSEGQAAQDGSSGAELPEEIDVIARFRQVDRESLRALPYSPDDAAMNVSGILCIGETPDKNVRVYGYNDEEIGFRGVALDVTIPGEGGEIYYYDWYYTTTRLVLPELYWNAGRGHLLLSCNIYTGTGADAWELHVWQRYGGMQDTTLGLDEYAALLNERIGWSFDGDTRRLVLTDQKTGRMLSETEVPADLEGSVTGLELGSISKFILGEETQLEVTPGYVIDDMWGAAQYDEMPKLRFQLLLPNGENGNFAFSLGELIDINTD